MWLDQKQLHGLFGKASGTASEYIKRTFEIGELTAEIFVQHNRVVHVVRLPRVFWKLKL